MNNKYIFLSVVCFFVVLMHFSLGSPPQEGNSRATCQGIIADGICDMECKLASNVGGSCDENNNCICVPRPTLLPGQEILGLCSPDNGDAKCDLQCRFFLIFKTGFCNNGVCVCVRKT